jgi:hypothetical protein
MEYLPRSRNCEYFSIVLLAERHRKETEVVKDFGPCSENYRIAILLMRGKLMFQPHEVKIQMAL